MTSELFGVRYQDTNFTSDKFVLKKAQTFADENDLTDLDTTGKVNVFLRVIQSISER